MFEHKSVLLTECIEGLNIKPDGIYVDCTLGGGGHSSEILKRLKTGHLYCFDQDELAIDAARKKLQQISNNFTIIKSNFVNIKEMLAQYGVTKVDGILFDLGVSSPQFDNGDRGFSYRLSGRIDMRMDQSQGLDGYEVVNNYSFQQLTEIFHKYGDEKFAKRIARKIESQRAVAPIVTTMELAEIVKSAIPAYARRTGGHPAKKVFQAIRVEVNDELQVFETALNDGLEILNVGGRIAVITFQSLEDKICKHIFTKMTTLQDVPRGIPIVPDELKPKYKLVNRKPIVASDSELEENRRSHSAKLRIIVREKL